MPKKIGGKKLSAKEHRAWKDIYRQTGSGAQATGAVKRMMGKRMKNHGMS